MFVPRQIVPNLKAAKPHENEYRNFPPMSLMSNEILAALPGLVGVLVETAAMTQENQEVSCPACHALARVVYFQCIPNSLAFAVDYSIPVFYLCLCTHTQLRSPDTEPTTMAAHSFHFDDYKRLRYEVLLSSLCK